MASPTFGGVRTRELFDGHLPEGITVVTEQHVRCRRMDEGLGVRVLRARRYESARHEHKKQKQVQIHLRCGFFPGVRLC